jgi:hypothetical protein
MSSLREKEVNMTHLPRWSWRDGENVVEEHEHLFGYDVLFSSVDEKGVLHPFGIVCRRTPMETWHQVIARRALICRSVENWGGYHRSMHALHEEE